MAHLDVVLPALGQGLSVQRAGWEPIIRMFVSSGMLMCQCGDSSPWPHAMGWDDIEASDWQLVQTVPSA
jgi:hypothetical protein